MTSATVHSEEQVITKPFVISVNKKPVQVEEPLVTGLQIKKAAIDQGVAIKLDFQLAAVGEDGEHLIKGDSEKIDVREFKTFYATAGDDNS